MSVEEYMQSIDEQLKTISKRLEMIENQIGTVEKDCSKMSEHVDFVDKVYSKVRYAFGLPGIKKLYIKESPSPPL
ncbi:MAG: hypothetical protein ACOYNN_17415 [Terrimicrobiaceae bacterium]|jgi:hypothetical protein